MNSAPDILSKIVTEFYQTAHDAKIQKQCALEIVFFTEETIDAFQAVIAPVAPNLKKYGHRLITFYSSVDMAQKASSAINSILYEFDKTLIEQEFRVDWLQEYLKNRHYGVDHAGARHSLESPSQINDYLSEKEIKAVANKVYTNKKSAAKLAAPTYSNTQMAEDFAEFIIANWEGYKDTNDIRQLTKGLMDIMKRETENMYHFSKYPSQFILNSIITKAEYINKVEINNDVRKQIAAVKEQIAIKNEFEKHSKDNLGNKRWLACAKQLESHINENAPDITLKGLSALLKDENAKIDKHTAFTGIDLSYDYEADMNKRLSPHTIRYYIQEQSYKQLEQLAGAIAAYYLSIMQIKQEVKFEELLIKHSTVMDKEPFFDHWLDMAAKSKPDFN